MKPRYLPGKDFPHYIFVPGENPHPKKSGGHMEGEKDPVVPQIDEERAETSEVLRYSLDLFNHGYFWESHVYFEALWNAHERKGPVADFLKGMIKLGAAGVKMKTGQGVSARGHIERARELFQEVMKQKGEVFLGFNLKDLIQKTYESPETTEMEVHPEWE